MLSVLTAGRPGPAPLADLTSERMAEIVQDSAAKFDWVLLDTPPVGLLPDAQVLVRLAGAVVFVIAAGSTPAAAVERAIAQVGTEAIIGTVLNRVEDRRIHEADYYDEYYGYSQPQQ
jgi:Mrp family chromosome partitioning ATPase